MHFILTFDLGTTGNKAALSDEKGAAVASHTVAYGVESPRPGWVNQQPEVFIDSCIIGCRALMDKTGCDPANIEGIGLSGTMNGCLAVDGEGTPLYPHIIHADARSGQQVKAMTATGLDWYPLVGNRASVRATAPKIMWLRDEVPDVYRRTRWFLQTKDFIRGFLTGDYGATDPSDAALTGLLDIHSGAWSAQALHACGLDGGKLPRVVPSASVAGTLTDSAAALLGLLPGTPVTMGGGDGACAARGAGLRKPGQAYICLGSTAWVAAMTDRLLDSQACRLINYFDLDGVHLLPTGTVQAATTSLDWALGALAVDGVEEATRLAESVPPGAAGLLFAPYLQGERTPTWDDDVRGAYIGITADHTRAHMVRAVYEGVACALRSVLDVFRGSGIDPAMLTILGGGARSALWLQILASLLPCPVTPHRDPGMATSMGAAMAAGVALGLWKDWEDAAACVRLSAAVSAHEEEIARYAPVYDAYSQVYEALSRLNPCLKSLREREGA